MDVFSVHVMKSKRFGLRKESKKRQDSYDPTIEDDIDDTEGGYASMSFGAADLCLAPPGSAPPSLLIASAEVLTDLLPPLPVLVPHVTSLPSFHPLTIEMQSSRSRMLLALYNKCTE